MSEQDPIKVPPAAPSEDAGSQALSDALRSSFFIVKIIMVGLVLLFFASGFFTVDPQHQAIILRLGKPVGVGEKALLGPGIHWSLPKPIDEVEQIPITSLQVADSTVGWYATREEMINHTEPPARQSINPATESYALTADTNIIHVTGTLRYRIKNPLRFHFEFNDAALFVTNALNNSLLFTAGEFSVDDAVTRRKAAFREAVAAHLRDLIDQQDLGISVEQLDVQAVPPRSLQAKFNEVLQAAVKRDEDINKAESYTNETLGKARGQAASIINNAEAARSNLVATVSAEANKFEALLPEYTRDPEFFKRVRQMTAIETVFSTAQEKILQPHLKDRELRLQLNREPRSPTVQTNQPGQ